MKPEQLAQALSKLGGSSRLLLYDVPEAEAPRRPDPATPFVRGGAAWWRFIERRRSLDDGQHLNLMVSLRGLGVEERLLAVNWGAAYANTILLVEPLDPWLDLTTDEGIAAYQGRSGAVEAEHIVRAAYAEWVYWIRDREGELESRHASLDLNDPGATLWQALGEQLTHTFSPADYLSSLTLLNLLEAELFSNGREVFRAIIPFLTRLGLPVLYDVHHVMQGMRELINAGLASASDPESGTVYRGPEAPLPADLSDESLALLLR